MTNYFEKDERWSIRAWVRTAKGFEHLTTPFLWPTKAAAEDDAKLFIWYRSVRGKIDPPVPTPYGQWFKSMLPNSDWDNIRDFLDERGEKVYAGLKRKCGQAGVALHQKICKQKLNDAKQAINDVEPPIELWR